MGRANHSERPVPKSPPLGGSVVISSVGLEASSSRLEETWKKFTFGARLAGVL